MILELQEIKRILLQEWDPIGVAETPEASDEYDAYAFQILTSLHSGATADSIAEYLHWVVSEHIGLPSDPTLNQAIAKKISVLHQDSRN
jgi:hypothetical protein